MNFSKVKLIIILCLLIVNIIFAVLCIRLISDSNYISEEEANLASANLSKNGISVEFDKDARRLYELPVYAVEANTDESYIPKIYKRITESFFGISVEDAAYIKTPDGFSVSVKNDDGMLIGSSSLSGNMHFECFLEDGVAYKELTDISVVPYLEKLTKNKNDEYDAAKNFVDSMLREYNMRFVYLGTRDYAGGKIVSFAGELSDTAVPGVYINVYTRKGRIVCCVGEIFDIAPVKKYSTRIVDSIDAVYLLSEYLRENGINASDKGAQIDNISMVYDFVEYSYGEYYIIPAWIMDYKEKNGDSETYVVDAVTGKGIRKLG